MEVEIKLRVPERRIGKYDWNFQDHLGSGSFAKVYCAKNHENGEIVAVKSMHIEDLKSFNLENNIQKEIVIMKSLNNPNIVEFYEAYMSKKNLYIVMEFCRQGDLRKFMKRKGEQGLIPEEISLQVLKDILNGFFELRKHNIVHRDLKPENILQNSNVFKISDFGFSTQISQNQILESLVGTPLYMSPQILKSLTYTFKCDIWALGMIYYELLNGKTPWVARTQYELVTKISESPVKFNYKINISEKSKEFINGCLQENEKNRFDWNQIFNHRLIKGNEKSDLHYNYKNINPSELDAKSIKLIQDIQSKLEKNKDGVDILFARLDKSKDNLLDIKEFSAFINAFFPYCEKSLINHVFNKFDVDKTGDLSISEFKMIILEKDFTNFVIYKDPLIEQKAGRVLERIKEIVKEKEILIKQLFDEYDTSKNNSLEIDEFEILAKRIDVSVTRIESEYMFEMLDLNNDKMINIEEFKNLFLGNPAQIHRRKSNFEPSIVKRAEKLAEICKTKKLNPKSIFENLKDPIAGGINFKSFLEFISKVTKEFSDKEINQVFRFIDSNDDGFIDFFEFQQIVE